MKVIVFPFALLLCVVMPGSWTFLADVAQVMPPQDEAQTRPGIWRPPAFDSPYGKAWQLKPGEINTIYDKLNAVTDVVRESPVLRSPVGFEVQVYHTVGGSTGAPRDAASRLPPSSVHVFLFVYRQRCASCPIEPEIESSGHVIIRFNDTRQLLPQWQKPFATDEQGGMHVGPARLADVAGFPAYQSPGKGPKFVLTNGIARPLWLAVNQERYIRARIAQAQKSLDDYRSRGQTNEYRVREIRELEAELAGLSSAERAEPACVGGTSKRPSSLISGTDPKAQSLIAENPEFYDRGRGRTTLQMAVVETYPAQLINVAKSFSARKVQEALQSIDWKKVAALLE